MKSIVLLLLTLLSLASALRVAMLPMRHVRLATTSRLAMSDAAAEEKEIFPKDADGNTLITYESLDKVCVCVRTASTRVCPLRQHSARIITALVVLNAPHYAAVCADRKGDDRDGAD